MLPGFMGLVSEVLEQQFVNGNVPTSLGTRTGGSKFCSIGGHGLEAIGHEWESPLFLKY